MRKYCIILILILFYRINSYSQEKDLHFRKINTENGLSHSSVLSILQDNYGFLWFGTYSGLNRYDGYNMKVFRTETSNQNTIPSNAVIALLNDSEGNIWIGTLGGGLSRFDPETEQFLSFPMRRDAVEGDFVPNVNVLSEDGYNDLWAGTNQGLFSYNKKENKFFYVEVFEDTLVNKNITAIHQGHSPYIWIGTENGFKRISRSETGFTPRSYSGLLPFEIKALYEDPSENLWIGTKGQGLYIFNEKTQKLTNSIEEWNLSEFFRGTTVYDILAYKPGEIWIACDNGLWLVNTDSKKCERYHHERQNAQSISTDMIRTLYKDKPGNIWIGTDGGGINITGPYGGKFEAIQDNDNEILRLSDNNIFSIASDAYGNLWIGTYGEGLDMYNPALNRIQNYKLDTLSQSPANKILSMDASTSGRLWIGTDEGGLFLVRNLPHAMPEHIDVDEKNGAMSSLKAEACYSVLEDHQGQVWVGTVDHGLKKIAFKEGTDFKNPYVTRYLYDEKDERSISSNSIFTIYEDKHDVIWIGTFGSGLNRRVIPEPGAGKASDEFIRYQHDPKDSSSISDNGIFAIYETAGGDFWIGTATGLNKMDRNKGTFKRYTVEDGLVNNVVFGIKEDSKGNLWLATHGGISCFNPGQKTFTNYTTADGLAGNVFNPDAFCRFKNGEMFFGGPNGITKFTPETFISNPVPPKAVIVDLKINNETFRRGMTPNNHPVSEFSVFASSTLHLDHRQNNLSFEFSSDDHSLDAKNRYAYRMLNLEEKWNKTDASGRFCNYSNLKPGKYIFQVKAANADGIWSTEPTQMAIILEPPFYKTLLFRILILSLLLFILLSGLQNYIRNRERKQRMKFYDQNRQLQTQKLLQEKELIRIKNERLDEEIRHKNKTLGKTAASIENQNSKIRILKKGLFRLESYIADDGMKIYRDLLKSLEADLNGKDEWKAFEQSFNETHNDFLGRIADEFPELTHVDLKFCAYIRMNLSNKEISQLLNLSLRGVETARLRIRKRMRIPKEDNLNDFILKY